MHDHSTPESVTEPRCSNTPTCWGDNAGRNKGRSCVGYYTEGSITYCRHCGQYWS
ncbi:uncharacterized protein EHS24_000786 [Apiotrichum porosum]|uniref:Uncharacterized protein n=1 Tax=Apiotrichum porosum TaxID=105984 RepID=A0A427YAW3_9TREE|nr:uncharacterized protein EHS24_000786 [Apiotrichum porosum]RSH88253.1 hypothetical protein EHS24_000786 [Apiotrichum porosum]